MRNMRRVILAGLLVLFSSVAGLAAAPPATRPAAERRPLAFVFIGESNSGGLGRNVQATPGEMAPRPSVQILKLDDGPFAFEDLRLGVNNIKDHAGLDGFRATCHGWENELANAVADGALPGYQRVYLVKAGQGGSRVAQWGERSDYWLKFAQRTDAARRQLGGEPQWVVWLSLGINDAIARTPIATWKTDVADYLRRIRQQLPGARIVMTRFESMGYPAINQAIQEIVAAQQDVAAIDSTGATLADANHWDYRGLKTVTRRLLAATQERLGAAPVADKAPATTQARGGGPPVEPALRDGPK